MALSDSAGLLFTIKANNKQALSELKETQEAIKALKAQGELSAAQKELDALLNPKAPGVHAEISKLQTGLKGAASEASNLVAIFTGDRLTGATSQLTSFAEAAGAISGPIGLAVGAVAGLTAGAAALGFALLEITKKTAEYGNSVFEMSEKTGLSAETISALKVEADKIGVSLDEVNRGLRLFTLLMGDAEKGSEKAKAKLADLHVTATDLDEGLAQVIKRIYELKPGIEQNTAAADAFGKRFGQELIPFINEFHGNLPDLIAKLKEMGLTMDENGARKSHEFEVQMKLLNVQFDAAWRVLGTQLLPVFLKWSEEVSGWLKRNQGEIKSWGDSIAALVDRVARDVARIGPELRILAAIQRGDYIGAAGELAVQTVKENTPGPLEPDKTALVRYQERLGHYGAVDPEAAKAAEDARKKAAEEAEKAQRERLASLAEYYRAILAQEKEAYDITAKGLEATFKSGGLTAEEYLNRSILVLNGYETKVEEILDRTADIQHEQAKNSIDRQTAAVQYQTAVAAAAAQKDIALNKVIDEINKKLDQDEKDDEARTKKKLALQELIIGKLREQGAEYDKLIQKEKEQASQLSTTGPTGQPGPDSADYRKSIFGADVESVFAGWLVSWKDFYDTVSHDSDALGKSLTTFAGMLTDAFQGFAEALGSVVQNWILYGTTGPAAMRKVLAAALATLAAEALARALMMTAYGIAALAFGDFDAAAFFFTSAAIFGAVAGVAAIAGRAVAGNSFKQQTNTATGHTSGGGTSGGGSGYYSSQSNTVQEEGRPQPGLAGQIAANVTVNIKDDSKWLGDMLEFQISTNGRVRKAIKAA